MLVFAFFSILEGSQAMKKCVSVMTVAMLVAAIAAGCGKKQGGTAAKGDAAKKTPTAAKADADKTDPHAGHNHDLAADGGGIVLCGKCGQVKGAPDCCNKGAAACKKCSLAKGSPGCCKIKKGTDVTLCSKCGQVKGGKTCCDPKAAKCAKCNKAKGSPGCCLKPAAKA